MNVKGKAEMTGSNGGQVLVSGGADQPRKALEREASPKGNGSYDLEANGAHQPEGDHKPDHLPEVLPLSPSLSE